MSSAPYRPSAGPSRTTLALGAVGAAFLGAVLAAMLFVDPDAAAALTRRCRVSPAVAASPSGYGTVAFANTCTRAVQPALQTEVARMHSFEAAPSRFEAVQARDAGCVIALWGAAMSVRGNPLGGTLGEGDRKVGRALVDRAMALDAGDARERALIGAMDVYYRSYPDHTSRARAYAERMDDIRAAFPDDPDIAALDGLAIIEGVDLSDRTYARQKRAAAILATIMTRHPGHPGAPHYLIHADDYAALARDAVLAAERYADIAPASSHAQHMPSHIWSMLGLWDRSIAANRRSGAVIDPGMGRDPTRGDIVFAHAFDFIAYARLQRGDDAQVADDIKSAGAAAPAIVAARDPLERGDWAGAARLAVADGSPFDRALSRFARAYGAARLGDAGRAETELAALDATRPEVRDAEGEYWAVFVDIYARAARGWIAHARGRDDEAVALMREAAAMDDAHEKHIYLENKIVPMRESLGDLLAALGRPGEALAAYRASLETAPNRYRSLLGAAEAAHAVGDTAVARGWYGKLVALSQGADRKASDRAGFRQARAFLAATD